MYSLQSYKDQCYNIGSPSPTPPKPPLTKLPKKLELQFDFSPTKPKIVDEPTDSKSKPAVTRIPRKRKCEIQKTPKSTKKPKIMDREEMLEHLKAQRQEYQDNLATATATAVKAAMAELKIDSRMNGFAKKLDDITEMNSKSNDSVKEHLSVVQDQMTNLQTSMDNTRIKFEEELVTLQGQFNNFQENALKTPVTSKDDIMEVVKECAPQLKDQWTKEILSPLQATWNAIQAEKVLEHDHSMIVFGYNATGNPLEAAGNFLKDHMKVPEDIMLKTSVKQAAKLGRGDASKPPPFLIKFGHPSERNMILTFSKNLTDKNIKIERQIPKNYQAQHKVFKEEQWKLKNMPGMGYKTQIVFDGHLLVLRYRSDNSTDGKTHWTVHDSWSPPMDSTSQLKTSLKTPTGSRASPAPSVSVTEESNRAFFMNLKGLTEQITNDTFMRELKNYLSPDHANLIADVKNGKKPDLFIVYCDSWASANTIASTYKDKFNNHEVSFTLFAKVDPALKKSQ